MSAFIDMTGQVFGNLIVIKRAETKSGMTRWYCLCDCGVTAIYLAGHLRSGHTKSCGCLRKELATKNATTHDMRWSPEYMIWASMKKRCLNKNDQAYRNYGGRGISVCDRWLKFENFHADMGPRPSPELSIDRINNDGNYEPSNCRWATKIEQNRNHRVYKNSPYGVAGITRTSNGGWLSQISVDGKGTILYRGFSFEAACRLRIEGEAKYWTGGL